jgi:hypothetical protein
MAAGCRLGFDDLPDDDAGDDIAGIPRLTVTVTGPAGYGMVVGPNGLSCAAGDTCVVDVDAGTTVTLRGLAATDRWFAGWSGPCGGNFDCELRIDTDVTIDAELTDRPNRVFVTSTAVDGAFGGVGAADTLCATSATNAGLGGTWVAYISAAGVRDAADLLVGSRGWVRLDGAPVADSPGQLADGPLAFVPRLDEYGDDVGSAEIYTGTRAGAAVAGHCNGWTSNLDTDDGAIVGADWGSSFAFDNRNEECNVPHALLCVEVGRNVPIAIKPDTGRIAFVSTAPWVPGGGRAAADALCAGEATTAGLPGTYLAAIATSTETIASRFTPGMPWRRVDGVRLTRDATLFVRDYLDVAPELDRVGQVVMADFWTGAPSFDQVAESNGNCNDWTVGDLSAMGDMHFTTSTWMGSPAKREPCDWAVPLLCLQE